MTPTRIAAAALACILALVSVAAPARADDDAATARARKHFSRGEKLFALGRFAEALEQYEAAFEAKPLPDFLFNVAQCHRNLGNLDQAVFGYRKYLKLAPDADNRAAVETLIEELEAEIEAVAERKRRKQVTQDPDPPRDDDRRISPWWYVGGGAAAIVITVGAVVLLSGDDGPSIPDSDLGNLDFGR